MTLAEWSGSCWSAGRPGHYRSLNLCAACPDISPLGI
jgi:hypothetical protein